MLALLDKLKLWATKAYLWIGLGAVVLLMVILFWRKKSGPAPTPGEIDALKAAAEGIKKQLTKADNDAQIKLIKAQATEDATKAQVDQIEKMDDELEKAKMLVVIRNNQAGK